jgi:Tfp pilus assembly protein PilX
MLLRVSCSCKMVKPTSQNPRGLSQRTKLVSLLLLALLLLGSASRAAARRRRNSGRNPSDLNNPGNMKWA